MIGASFRERLAKGEVLVGCNVRHSRTAEIGAILADCGFAWIMLDHEHSPMAPHLAYDIGLGAIRAGVVPLARVRANDPAEIGSCLTNGALGVIVPHANSGDEALAAARASRFPPQGELSVPGTMPQFGYGRPLAESTTIEPVIDGHPAESTGIVEFTGELEPHLRPGLAQIVHAQFRRWLVTEAEHQHANVARLLETVFTWRTVG